MFESCLTENGTFTPTGGFTDNLPYKFSGGGTVVYDNKIHILGTANAYSTLKKCHFTWDGESWFSVSVLPKEWSLGTAIVYDNKIHIFPDGKYHYAWNGEGTPAWISVSTLPETRYGGTNAVVYQNKIYVDCTSYHKLYSWNNSTWQEETTKPIAGNMIVFNNKIHLFGLGATSLISHYTWDGITWEFIDNYSVSNYKGGMGFVLYNNKIHIIGGNSSTSSFTGGRYHASWDGEYHLYGTNGFSLPYLYAYGGAVVYNDKIHLLGGSGDGDSDTKHYYWEDPENDIWTNYFANVQLYDSYLANTSNIIDLNNLYIKGRQNPT